MYDLSPQPAKRKSSCLSKIVKGALIIFGLFVALMVVAIIVSSRRPTTIAPAAVKINNLSTVANTPVQIAAVITDTATSALTVTLGPPGPTSTPTNTPLPTSTSLPTDTPLPPSTQTSTPLPSNMPLPTSTPLPTNTPLPTSTSTDTNTPIPTSTLTSTLLPTATQTTIPTNTPLPPTNTPLPAATPTLAWYVGGTLHSATITEWRVADERNKLATAADWAAVGFDLHSEAEYKIYAPQLLICMNTAFDTYAGLHSESDTITDLAVGCVITMKSSK